MVILPPDKGRVTSGSPPIKNGGVILPPDGENGVIADAGLPTGLDDWMAYNAILRQQASEVEKFGIDVTVAMPRKRDMDGYEDEINKIVTAELNKSNYEYRTTKAFIDFHPKRGVFYKFNWIPEDADQLTAITFHPAVAVFADTWVRTVATGNVSPFGDLIFHIVKIFDEGKYETLKRTAFARMISDQMVWQMLFTDEKAV